MQPLVVRVNSVAPNNLGDVWHFIDELGNIAVTCGRGVDIKPLRNGATRMVRDDGREVVIYIDGRIEEV